MVSVLRNHVPAITVLLSLVSLGVVFSAVLGLIPSSVLPQTSPPVIEVIPHVNAGISLLAIGSISFGWYSIRAGNIQRHRTAMLTTGGLFGLFLLLYLYKVALVGPEEFPGPTVLYQFVYLPLLIIHMTLAVICIPLVYYVALLGLSRPIAEIPQTNHPNIGRIAASLWLLSFGLGFVVYLLLYQLL